MSMAQTTIRRFGPTLRRVRTDAGLSQEELAKLLNTTQGHLSRLETGYVRPSLGMALTIAQFFDKRGEPALLAVLTGGHRVRAS